MADHPAHDEPVVHDETHMSENEFQWHERTYSAFLQFIKWNIIVIVIVLIFMGLFLT